MTQNEINTNTINQGCSTWKHSSLRILLLIFFPFTCGYFFTAFFNQVNAVAGPYLNQSIALNASQMGLMTAVYLLAFSLFQLPLGVLLDRFGAKRVQILLFIVAALGIWVFSHAHSYHELLLGRAIIGLGLSAGLMAGFKAIRQWFPAKRIALCNSCMMALGSVGALFSTTPTAYLLTYINWRSLFNGIAIGALLTAGLILLLVIEKPRTKNNVTFKELTGTLKHIYSSSYFWRITPICALIFATNMSMAGLWAGQWFRHVSMYSPIEASHHLFVITVSLIIGIFLNGLIADRMTNQFNQPITRVMGVGFCLFIIMEILIIASPPLSGSYLAWFLFGFFGRNVTLGYAAISQHFPANYAGRSVTAMNMLYFLTSFVMQFAFGAIINLWPITTVGTYPTVAYHIAFALMVGLQIIALLWFAWYRKPALGR